MEHKHDWETYDDMLSVACPACEDFKKYLTKNYSEKEFREKNKANG